MSEYYVESGAPGTGAVSSSADIRNEFIAIEAGTDKLPALAGNADRIVTINAAGSAMESTTAANARTKMGVAIGTNVQAYDATLQSIAALGTAADRVSYTTGVDTWAETPLTAAGRALVDDATAAAQRTTLGSTTVGDAVFVAATTAAARTAIGAVIGTDVQAYDADLSTLAANITAAGHALVDDVSAAAQRTTLGSTTVGDAVFVAASTAAARTAIGAVIGTDVQAYDADLAAIAALTSAADKGIQFTGAGTAATFDLTAAAKTVLDDATVAAMRTTLGAVGTNSSEFKGARHGNIWSHNATDVTNDWDITAGGCMDSTGVYFITTAALTKQADVAWAVGTAAGMLDTGAVANSDYYIWAIARSDTGVTDYLSSLSSTAPTMPANYDYRRLIGWFKRVAGVNVLMDVYETEGGGVEVAWRAPTADVGLTNTLSATRRTDAVKVPLNFSVIANLTVQMSDAASLFIARVMCPDETDGSITNTANIHQVVLSQFDAKNIMVRTSAAGLIAAKADLNNVDTYTVATNGFSWARRN